MSDYRDNNFNRSGGGYRQQNTGYGNSRQPSNRGGSPQRETYVPAVAENLPEDYVDLAEKVIMEHKNERQTISTSKLRNLLSMVSDIYNTENMRTDDTLTAESRIGLEKMRIRVAYEGGRDPATKRFIESAKLLSYLKGINGSRDALIRFSHYMEALVAYHRFIIGGKEN